MTEDTQAKADVMHGIELSNKARVFVTTEKIQTRISDGLPVPSIGKWFQLNDYADKAAFMESAHKFVVDELEDTPSKTIFTHIAAGFDATGLFGANNEPLDDLWAVFCLSDEDFIILAVYSRVVPMKNGVAASLAEAKRNYIGYFPTNKDFAIHKLRQAGMSDEALALIDDCCDFNKLANTQYGCTLYYHNHIFSLFN